MYVRKRRIQKRKPIRKVRKGVRRVRRGAAPNFARKVKSVMLNYAEVKSVNTDPTTYAFNANNSTCSPAVDLCVCLENIATGNTDGSRVGNRIRLKQFDLVCNLTMNPSYVSSATFRGGMVQIWLATLKSDKFGTPNATDLTRIYEDGSGSVGPSSSMLETLRDLNKNYFNFHAYRKFKLGPSGSPYPNNDFPIQKSVVFKNIFKPNTTVVYNDGLLATNKAMFMFCHFTEITSQPLTVSVPVTMEYFVRCKYIDI